jgi:hypothetical protein
VTHYLKAVEAIKSDDGTKVVAQMKAMPTDDAVRQGRSAPTAARSTGRTSGGQALRVSTVGLHIKATIPATRHSVR